MKISQFIESFEQKIPLGIQENYDNCGLQLGNPNSEIAGILYTLDINEACIQEAVAAKCNLIISHHPFIFNGLKKIDVTTSQGSIIQTCIRQEIAIYSAHTNLDKSPIGVSAALASVFSLLNTTPLVPEQGRLKKLVTFCPQTHSSIVRNALFEAGAGQIGHYDSCSFNTEGYGSFRAGEDTNPFVGEKGHLHQEPETRIETVFPSWKQKSVLAALLAFHPYEEVAYDIYPIENKWTSFGLGMVGNLPNPMSTEEFLDLVKSKLNTNTLRSSLFNKKTIHRVAVCGGSGASFLPEAFSAGAQAYITADVKYHDFQAAANNLLLIDAGHFETEIYSLTALKSLVSEFLPTFAPQIIYPDSNWVNAV